jgi:hypothetical protein
LFLPLILILIGFSGILLSNIYSQNSDSRIIMFNIYNAYAQFTFLFVSFIYIYYFSEDFNKGGYAFYKQIGYSLKACFKIKSFILFLISAITVDIFLILAALFLKIGDLVFISTTIISMTICLLYNIVFSAFLSFIFKKTMVATVINFAIYIISNVLNLITFGLINPMDGNSLNTVIIKYLASNTVTHKTLSKFSDKFHPWEFPLSTVIPFIYTIVFIVILYLLTKEKKRKL